MALPQVNTPTYELAVPSTDEKIKYRPFLVKEEKILMIAMEGKEQSGILDAVKQIVKSCTFDKFDMSKAPMFDVEYIFLNIRAKSVGEISTVNLRCLDDNETFVKTEIDLTEVEVKMDEEHTNKIELTEEMGMIMTYPNLDSFADYDVTNINASNMIDMIASCIAQIYDKKGEDVYDSKDSTHKELVDFIEQLNSKQFAEVQKFFDTMPKLTHTVTIENPKTKKKSEIVLSGLNDFFV
jgi:hypothetical protein|tara:strand:- start:622 stop:1335 length:714 start_codon:yes stop_codon:yes gene_type:complete